MAHDTVELRGMTPRETIDVLDAVSGARRMSRIELVNHILHVWCQDRLMESSLIQRVTNVTPHLAVRAGKGAE